MTIFTHAAEDEHEYQESSDNGGNASSQEIHDPTNLERPFRPGPSPACWQKSPSGIEGDRRYSGTGPGGRTKDP